MSTPLRATVVGSPPPNTPAVPVSDPDDGLFAAPSAASLVLPPSSSNTACPNDDVKPNLDANLSVAQDTTSEAHTISPDALPDVLTINEYPLSFSTAPLPSSSVDTLPSDLPIPADSGIPSIPSGEGSPCSGSTESELAGHPASDAVPPLCLDGPSPGRVSDVRHLLSIGVQTEIVLTKRGKQALSICYFM